MATVARSFKHALVVASVVCLLVAPASAQQGKACASTNVERSSSNAVSPPSTGALPAHIGGWISRLQQAAATRNYVGTLVVSSNAGALSSARVSHACSGEKQLERIESLTGIPRITYRWGHEVHTFLPQTRTHYKGHLDMTGGFPSLSQLQGTAVADFYQAIQQGTERVAGLEADIVWLKPADNLRFGYRLWSERETGLVLKLQTLQTTGAVLEQIAFSEVDLKAAVPLAPLRKSMQSMRGYQVVDISMRKTSAADHGWMLRRPVPGFVPVHCYVHGARPDSEASNKATLQCTYSDGLASVSLFMEPYGRAGNGADSNAVQRAAGRSSTGATHTLAQRVGPNGWLTAIGEVPLATLLQFAQALEQLP